MKREDRFLVVSCSLGRGGEEMLGEVLLGLPTLGCEILPGEHGGMEARIYFSTGDSGAVAVLQERLLAHGAAAVAGGELEAEDWVRAYRERAVAFPVGKSWWIDPRPESGQRPPAGRRRLVVEPRMAFGSGSHETTRLVLMELETLALAGRSVLDVGTGSGILVLAASALGARLAVGLDIDLRATFEARRTASEQDRLGRAGFLAGPVAALTTGYTFDLVLCNMIWERMRPLIPDLFRLTAPAGRAVLSGLLCVQEKPAVEELLTAGFELAARRDLGEWLGLVVRRD